MGCLHEHIKRVDLVGWVLLSCGLLDFMGDVMNVYEDDFIRVRSRPDQWMPDIEHRRLERRVVGTYFFGLFKRYEFYYTEWSKE